jgi:hypothetical protein
LPEASQSTSTEFVVQRRFVTAACMLAMPRLIEAIAASLHTIYIIAGVFAVLALAATLLIPGA